VDKLHGLKENVIIGGLIPAGTGILKETRFSYDRSFTYEDDSDSIED
jgi:DNA-directed RNA polymerase subunit beta'